jgi:hypothetical protein
MQIKKIIAHAIDIHVHVGPEIIPRKYTVSSLIKKESGKIGGMVFKNHFYPTMPFISELSKNDTMRLFGGVVLNNALGGMNAEAIYASSILSQNSIMVWFPTINAKQFLNESMYEIAPEWVQRNDFEARYAKDITPVDVIKSNKVAKNVMNVLQTIKKCNAVLATGHLSWQESVMVIAEAQAFGVKKIVVTHPIYQRIAMPISVQKKLTEKGCFLEQSYSMYSIDKIPMKEIALQIKAVGSGSVILSSDMGQTFSPSPSEALIQFAQLLIK